MKSLTIQQKIIGWYTLFFLSLIVANILILSVASGNRINQSAVETLLDVTEDVLEELVITSNGVFLQDDDRRIPFRYYEDGVLFVLYLDNQIIGGVFPAAISNDFSIQPFSVQRYEDEQSNWYLYDVPFASGYTLRGFYNYTTLLGANTGFVQTLILLAPVLLLIAAFGGVFLIRRAFQPLTDVVQTTQAITQGQNYTLRVPLPQAKDDIYRLTESVNAMVTAMQSTLDREKAFSSNVSHELRTPLTNIKAQLEYVISSSKNKQTKELESILTQTNLMQEIIDQMMEWSRLSNTLDIDKEVVDVQLVLESLIDQFQSQLEKKTLTLTSHFDATASQVLSTPATISRVFTNILHNAVKFTPAKGQLIVSTTQTLDHLIITVTDTGIGMNDEQLSKIFNPFYQADTSRSHEGVSLGIGLTLTKQLILQDNGQIEIHSVPHEGTTVVVSYPIVTK